jgi:membrane-associated PAP2 superfamily phosphatase
VFTAEETPTGTGYTTTVALLLVALVFVRAVLAVSRPLEFVSVSIGIACSALCVISARVSWKRWSRLTIASIAMRDARTK